MLMYKVSRLKDCKQEHPSRPTVQHNYSRCSFSDQFLETNSWATLPCTFDHQPADNFSEGLSGEIQGGEIFHSTGILVSNSTI